MKKIFILALTIFTFIAHSLDAQTYIGMGADFGIISRSGNWAETYGNALLTGVRGEAGLNNGILLNLQGELQYGNDVKIDPLVGLRGNSGILGDESDRARPADVALKSRGFRIAPLIGYQAAFNPKGWGYRALLGPSYTQHFIRVQDDATLTTSNLRQEYKRGYDRRAAGFGAYAEAGFQYQQADRGATFFIVGHVNVFGSKALNSVQFDLGEAAPSKGTDIGYGVKAGLTLALFKPASQRTADEIYY